MNIKPFQKPVLALQWDRSSLEYVVAEQKAGQIKIKALGSVPLVSDDETSLSPGAAIEREVHRLGLRRPDTIVALNRGQVDVIPLQLPPASDSELPTMVANQVVRDAGELAETGIVDFVALDGEENLPRQVFAFVADAGTLDGVMAECDQASLKPCAVVYRPLASVSLLLRMVPKSQRTMILATMHDFEADLSIVRNGRLLYTRTARLSETRNMDELAGQLAVEVRRSLTATSLTMDAENQHLYIFGALDRSQQLVEQLAEELSLPASVLDPMRTEQIEDQTPEDISRVSPVLGMVYEHFAKAHPLDFLHPKQPPPPPNYVRRGAVYGAAAAVLLALGLYYVWDARAKSEEEATRLNNSLNKIVTQLDKVKEKQAVVDSVQRWEDDNVNWLDELYDITQRFPNGQDAMIRRLSAAPGRGGQNVVDMTVQVRDPQVITQLGDQLRDEHHDVSSKDVSEQASSEDYPWQFETRIYLRKRDPDQYRKTPSDEKGQQKIAANAAGNALEP